MAKNITLMGASYTGVPSVTLPQTGGGTASFTDVSATTATASTILSGYGAYGADGAWIDGTATSGGGSGVDVTITSVATNTLALVQQLLAGFPFESTDTYYAISLKSADNVKKYNIIIGGIAFYVNQSAINGSLTRYRNGSHGVASIASNYDANASIGDVYTVNKFTPAQD